MKRFLLPAIVVLLLTACSSTNYNPTVYDYQINTDILDQSSSKNIMIAPVNFSIPSRYYLKKHEKRIDGLVKDYLKEHDYKITSNRSFLNHWKRSEGKFGDTFNPSTGLMTEAHQPVLLDTIEKTFKSNSKLDYIIFTDIIEQDVKYNNKKIAIWSGVRRKLKTEGTGDGVPPSFDWNVTLDGLSIATYVVDRQQQLVFHSVGGIQVAQALLLKSNARFKRRNDLLHKDKEILEGIALALHPMIPMGDYPGEHK